MDRTENWALLTDLYELTMAQAYFQSRHAGTATFSLFVRAYPAHRGYFVSAGLGDVLRFLEELEFDGPGLDYLASTRIFTEDFLHFLSRLRFRGDVWAIPEGRVYFKDEPILEITAPIIEAQLAETFVINQIHLQSLIATKAARCVHAARGRPVVDFSLRRTHGTDAGLKTARASYIGGFAATSNVLAGRQFGIPIVGTMAHSFVSSYEREIDAFKDFVASFPDRSILLIDTYDPIAGARNAVRIGCEMASRGERLQGVRIDSGDLTRLGFEVRKLFDQAGLKEVKIVGSGGLDEFDLEELAASGAPYDSFGVGTKMGVSADAPFLDIAYKLTEYDGRPVVKLSPGKESWPGRKQVYRRRDPAGRLQGDVVALRDETVDSSEPVLVQVMSRGERTRAAGALEDARRAFREDFAALPEACKAIRNPAPYPVRFSPGLESLRERVLNGATVDRAPTSGPRNG